MHILILLAALGQFPALNRQAATAWPSFREPPTRPVAPEINPPSAAQSGDRVLVMAFTSTWCGPCARIKPALDALEAEGAAVRRVDYDSQQPLALAHNVTTLPTTIVLERGVEVNRRVGILSLDELRTMTRPHPPGPDKTDPVPQTVNVQPPTTRGQPPPFRLFRRRGPR